MYLIILRVHIKNVVTGIYNTSCMNDMGIGVILLKIIFRRPEFFSTPEI